MTPLPPVDLSWFRHHLVTQLLPHWLESAVTDQGLFLPHLDRQWRPKGANFGTVVSQSRLLYNFACGHRTTRSSSYLDAVRSGTRFLLDHFRDRKHGGWYHACNLDGSAMDTAKSCYGHAFAMFGLSHAYAVLHDSEVRDAAIHTWQTVHDHFAEPGGGFVSTMPRDFGQSAPGRSQNPLMHLFEALLAGTTVGHIAELREPAERLATFVTRKLASGSGLLPEVYDSAWVPLTAAHGGRVDVGHAFEWAYLLSHAVDCGLETWLRSTAEQFLDQGLTSGFDPKEGGIRSPAGPDGVVRRGRKGWWEQCEATRALMHFALRHGRSELLPKLDATLAYLKRAFVDKQFGGWYSTPTPHQSTRGCDKGSEWKVDYHVVGMCMEAVELSEGPTRRLSTQANVQP